MLYTVANALRQHRINLCWFWFLLWLALGTRITLGTGVSLSNLVDDLGFVFLFGGIFMLSQVLDRPLRFITQSSLAVFLTLVFLADCLHLAFFGTYINVESVFLLAHLPAASSSVSALMTPAVWFFGVALPCALAVWALYQSLPFRAHRLGFGPVGMGLVGILFLLLHWLQAPATDAAMIHNPLFLFARQLIRGPTTLSTESETTADKIADNVQNTFAFAKTAEIQRAYPLLQKATQPSQQVKHPYNVVLILMESIRSLETGLGTGYRSYTPNLYRIAQASWRLENFYAVADQTVRGEAAILCSLLTNFGGAPTYVRYPFIKVRCLPEILADHGYNTHWISSYSADYMNKRKFLSTHGIQQIHDMHERDDLIMAKIGWGAPDSALMQYATQILGKLPQPFFAEIMTLSNHHPFNYHYEVQPEAQLIDQNENRLYQNYIRGVYYTDWAVGRFFEQAKKQPWFNNTIFLFAADHGVRVYPRDLHPRTQPAQQLEILYRSPLLIYGPNIEATVSKLVSSQIDIAPSVLDLLGIQTDHAFMGVSLFAPIPPEKRFAVMSSSNEWNIRRDQNYCYSIGRTCLRHGHPRCPNDHQSIPATHACFHTAADLLHFQNPNVGASMEMLQPTQARELMRQADRLVRYTRFVLQHDILYP